ncbi:1,5-anhydro-D-fructose reductase-like [Haemaphysalis longicornis]
MSKTNLPPTQKKEEKPAPATAAKSSKEQPQSSQEQGPSSSCGHTDPPMPPCVFQVDRAGRTIRHCVLMNNGVWMPMVGLSICKGDTAHIERIVEDAVLSGYRHIDTAHASHNETAIGNALQRMMASGKVKRDELFIVTKGMEDAANLGMTRSIGLCNFNKKQISRILDAAAIKPANLQIECHAYLDQKDLVEFCKQHSISVTAYAPLGSPAASGVRSPSAKKQSWHTHSTLLENATLRKMADRYKKTPAQVLIRWLLQRGIVPLPRSTSTAHIQENIQVFDFELSQADSDTLFGLNKNQRLFTYDVYGLANKAEYPFK